MASSSSMLLKITGIALMVTGIGLGYWGYELSGSVESQITQTLTGAATDKVMQFYIGGAVSFIVGLYLFIKN
ncbi:MAG: DUF3185 family protein [Gammaproteobacteria bacterium]|nr:DUF3185 family protein [Gammaproteobacteria bacterium]